MGGKKSSKFTKDALGDLAKDKPVVYKIRNAKGDNVYTGVAKRGRVEERLREHLPGGEDAIPGARRVEIQQKSSIGEARKSEARIIKRSKPRHNKQGK